MKFFRPQCLTAVFVCIQGLITLTPAWSQNTAAQQSPAAAQPAPPAQPAPAQPKPANPFETVPQSQTPPPGTPPPFEAPKVAPAAPRPAAADSNTIAAIEFRGSRRVPQDTLRAMIFSKVGEPYSEDTAHRDFMALWNTGRFDDIKLESEQSPQGLILRFVLTERPVVRTIRYENINSITTSEILDRFKERKVGLVVESQYDPNKVQRAAVVIKELLCRTRPSVRHGRASGPSRFPPVLSK